MVSLSFRPTEKEGIGRSSIDSRIESGHHLGGAELAETGVLVGVGAAFDIQAGRVRYLSFWIGI